MRYVSPGLTNRRRGIPVRLEPRSCHSPRGDRRTDPLMSALIDSALNRQAPLIASAPVERLTRTMPSSRSRSTPADPLAPYRHKRDFSRTKEPSGSEDAGGFRRRVGQVRGPAASGQQAALRLPARDRRRTRQLGGAQGADPGSGRTPSCLPRRGPPAGLFRLRGRHSGRRIRRRRRHRLGCRHLGTARPQGRRRSARGRRRRRAAPRHVRREAARPVHHGAHPDR